MATKKEKRNPRYGKVRGRSIRKKARVKSLKGYKRVNIKPPNTRGYELTGNRVLKR